MANSSFTITNGDAQAQLTVKLQTSNGDPTGTVDVKVPGGENTVVAVSSGQRIVITPE